MMGLYDINSHSKLSMDTPLNDLTIASFAYEKHHRASTAVHDHELSTAATAPILHRTIRQQSMPEKEPQSNDSALWRSLRPDADPVGYLTLDSLLGYNDDARASRARMYRECSSVRAAVDSLALRLTISAKEPLGRARVVPDCGPLGQETRGAARGAGTEGRGGGQAGSAAEDPNKQWYKSMTRRKLLTRGSVSSSASEDLERSSEGLLSKQRRRRGHITANLCSTRYDVVYDAAVNAGFEVIGRDDPSCFLLWSDAPFPLERIAELKPHQHINHFPGMGEISRKDLLARNMTKMAKLHPHEFNFVPKTWILPAEFTAFMSYANDMRAAKKVKTFIMKPVNGAMGNGIQLVRNFERVQSSDHCIIQEYVEKPLLVDGFKCDMRIYVLVTSCDPLRVHLFNNGLLRMATEKYKPPSEDNLSHLFMHLTNYAINKRNENFRRDDAGTSGSKRSLTHFIDYLREHVECDVGALWQNITDLIVKTMIVALPHVYHAYRMCRAGDAPAADSVCFEVLGFDILLDRKMRPWLLEINRAPSFGVGQQLDYDIKLSLLVDTFNLLNVRAKDKSKNIAEQKAQALERLLRPAKRGESISRSVWKQERKKEQLTALLDRIVKEEKRDTYEFRNSGNFRRIFPPVDRAAKHRYIKFLTDSFQTFQRVAPGRQVSAGSLYNEVHQAYNSELKDYEVREMIAQCEADQLQGVEEPEALSEAAVLKARRHKSTLRKAQSQRSQFGTKPYGKFRPVFRPTISPQRS